MEVDKKEGDLNDNKLVTVAIHTYEKAQILKTILEYEGIESVIHGINIIEPSVPEVSVLELEKRICRMHLK